jgi:hypothetical protein
VTWFAPPPEFAPTPELEAVTTEPPVNPPSLGLPPPVFPETFVRTFDDREVLFDDELVVELVELELERLDVSTVGICESGTASLELELELELELDDELTVNV